MTRALFTLLFFGVAFSSSAQPGLEMSGIGLPLEQMDANLAMQEPVLVIDDTWHPAIQAFIDQYFPDRSKMPNGIYELLNKLQALDDETIIRAKLNEIVQALVEPVDNSALAYFDVDTATIVLDQLQRCEHQAFRLVCYVWRAYTDWYLRHRAKRKKAKPVLRQIHEDDFFRMVQLSETFRAIRVKDYSRAFRLASDVSSYEVGNAEAMYVVGHLFLMGKGVTRSIREGLYQLNNAAEAGLPAAIYDLGIIFSQGIDADKKIAVVVDHKKAFAFFQRAHDLGHKGATYELGRMYYEGWHGQKDPQKGLLLIKQAASKGYKLAKTALKDIEG